MKVERERLRHAVLAVMGGEIVVPLPDVARERLLGIHLDLLDVELIAQDLPGGLHEPRMADEAGIDVAAPVQGHGRAHGIAPLLPEVLRPALGEQARQLRLQHLDLPGREQRRENKEPVFPELRELPVRQLHGIFRGR